MAKQYFWDENSKKVVQDAIKKINNTPYISPTRPPILSDTPYLDTNSSSQVYAARALEDIRTLQSVTETLGSSSSSFFDVEGGFCQVYQVSNTNGKLLKVQGHTPLVYNLSDTEIPKDAWIIIKKDAYGSWFADSIVTNSDDCGTPGDKVGCGSCKLVALRSDDCVIVHTFSEEFGEEDTILTYSGGHWTSEDLYTYPSGAGTFDFYYADGRMHLKLADMELIDCGDGCYSGSWLTGHANPDTGTGTDNKSCDGTAFTVCLECVQCPEAIPENDDCAGGIDYQINKSYYLPMSGDNWARVLIPSPGTYYLWTGGASTGGGTFVNTSYGLGSLGGCNTGTANVPVEPGCVRIDINFTTSPYYLYFRVVGDIPFGQAYFSVLTEPSPIYGCDTSSDCDKAKPITLILSADPSTGSIPLSIDFNASITGGLPSYNVSWDFGDGTTGTGPITHHIFTSPGSYEVIARLIDSCGRDAEESIVVTVSGDGNTCESPTILSLDTVVSGSVSGMTEKWYRIDGVSAGTWQINVTTLDNPVVVLVKTGTCDDVTGGVNVFDATCHEFTNPSSGSIFILVKAEDGIGSGNYSFSVGANVCAGTSSGTGTGTSTGGSSGTDCDTAISVITGDTMNGTANTSGTWYALNPVVSGPIHLTLSGSGYYVELRNGLVCPGEVFHQYHAPDCVELFGSDGPLWWFVIYSESGSVAYSVPIDSFFCP